MELEEMKTLWETMSDRVEKLELLNKQNIMEMTELKYRNKFNKLRSYELVGAVVCYLFGTLTLLNLYRLDTWYLMLFGILIVAFYYLAPIVSLGALKKVRNINISEENYKQTIVKFEKAKARMLYYQRLGIGASIVLMLMAIPVADKMFNDNNVFENIPEPSVWITTLVAAVFIYFVSRWGYGWYKKIARSAETVLKDIEE
ncbi:MAG: hypothetical protein Aureis2KO_12440 [Aureisphaera sp.]